MQNINNLFSKHSYLFYILMQNCKKGKQIFYFFCAYFNIFFISFKKINSGENYFEFKNKNCRFPYERIDLHRDFYSFGCDTSDSSHFHVYTRKRKLCPSDKNKTRGTYFSASCLIIFFRIQILQHRMVEVDMRMRMAVYRIRLLLIYKQFLCFLQYRFRQIFHHGC